MNRRNFLRSLAIGSGALVAGSLSNSLKAQDTIQTQGNAIYRKAQNTVTPVLLDRGDILKFTLNNGQTRTIKLLDTDASILLTNVDDFSKVQPNGGTIAQFTAKILVDGHVMTMKRYLPAQKSFYEPYVINGMRIWFDAVQDYFKFFTLKHGWCKPRADVRFAVSDATDPVAPEVAMWYPNENLFIDVEDSYLGGDVWMGPYLGGAPHAGLDINMPAGTDLFSPIPIDEHYFFDSLAKGDNNNRWRGIHQWHNGDKWIIQAHHMLNLLIPEHTSIKTGIHYAKAAGVRNGANEHSHFVFKIKTPENKKPILLDPWIIFWQSFENEKRRAGEIKAYIEPLSPGSTGIPISFHSEGSRDGQYGKELSFYWTFGDGGFSNKANPQHTYLKPGIYSVTLVVDNGAKMDSYTQHITIDGPEIDVPGLALMAKDEPSFRIRPTSVMDVYGKPVPFIPHSLHFFARATRPKPEKKVILLQNNGSGVLPQIVEPKVTYSEGSNGWLSIEHEGKHNNQKLIVSVNATGLASGRYSAWVQVECPEAINAEQRFLVQLTVPTYPPADKEMRDVKKVVIDDTDERDGRFYCTPYFWVQPQFERWGKKGFQNSYLTNGGRAEDGEFARFIPDLEAGRYEVSFAKETPFKLYPDTRFAVRIRSKNGDGIIWVEPAKSKIIGTFEFYEGMDGFVEILAEGSTGQVLVDAVVFKKIE